jgi:hypothetical protein
VSFYMIAGFEAVRSQLAGEHPEASWAGFAVVAVWLALAVLAMYLEIRFL